MSLTLFLKYAAYALMIGLLLALYKTMMDAAMRQSAVSGFGPLSPGYLDRLLTTSDPLLMFGCTIIILVLLFTIPTIVGRLVGQSLGMPGMAAGRAVGIVTSTLALVGGALVGAAALGGGPSGGGAAMGAAKMAPRPSMPPDQSN
jgi:hypothetical protein